MSVYKMYPTFRPNFVYVLLTKRIQKFVKMWYTFLCIFCIHFLYISCIHLVQFFTVGASVFKSQGYKA